jgi:hypothetical protein
MVAAYLRGLAEIDSSNYRDRPSTNPSQGWP